MDKAEFCRERAQHYRRLVDPLVGNNNAMAAKLIWIAVLFEAAARLHEIARDIGR
jgi:hypothetical protein